jgi:alpha-tubulin suppressor-like RCC1 family protein
VQVKDPNDPSGYLSGVQAIATHSGHSLTLKDDGTVWAWGGNISGQLGDGTNANSTAPVQVSEVGGVKAIAAGGSHSLAVQ